MIPKIAALYVMADGPYAGLPGVDVWDKARDARTYAGPWPVVAHPPCERWCTFWNGGPDWIRRGLPPKVKGDDDGCFRAALAAVRRWGGVLEHPRGSGAWEHFGLIPPRRGGWSVADWQGGWTCCVDQGHYGHRAPKATWLYACGVAGADLPSLVWGKADTGYVWDLGITSEKRKRAIRTGICQRLSRRQRAATPEQFRDLLLSIARSARGVMSQAA
jgi:hypothetical protein